MLKILVLFKNVWEDGKYTEKTIGDSIKLGPADDVKGIAEKINKAIEKMKQTLEEEGKTNHFSPEATSLTIL